MPLPFLMGHLTFLVGNHTQVQEEVTKCTDGGSRAGTREGQAAWRKLAVDSKTHVIEAQEPASSSRAGQGWGNGKR